MSKQAKPLPLTLLLAVLGGCVEPPLELGGDDEFRQANEDVCGALGAMACMYAEGCSVFDFVNACDPCGMEAAAACFAVEDCAIDDYMDTCGHDNDHTQQIEPGEVVVAEFDSADGTRYEVPLIVGSDFGDRGLVTTEGDFACMGKCGDGCDPLVFETHDLIPKLPWLPDDVANAIRDWTADYLAEHGVSSIQLFDVWSRDCLEHDLCSYRLWKGGPSQEQDIHCGDEWVDTYDDFLPPFPQVLWTSGGPFCASSYGEGAMQDREHVVGRHGDTICGPDGKAWYCDANQINDPWTKTNASCAPNIELEDETVWGGGVCRTYTATNTNDFPLQWEVELPTPDGLYLEHWNTKLVDHGTSIEFRGDSWNATLGPQQSTSFGYCREGLSGQCDPGPEGCAGLTVNQLPPSSHWGTGLCRGVEVINFATDWVDWEVTLEIEGELTESWNTSVSCAGTTCTFSGENWNDILAPDELDDNFPGGGSASFGYCVEGIGDELGGDGDGDPGGDGDGDEGGDPGGDGDGDGDGELGPDPAEQTVMVYGSKPGNCQGGDACLHWWEDSDIDVEPGQTVSLSCPPNAGTISWTAGAPQTCAGQVGTWDASIAPECPVFSLVAKVGAHGVPQCIGMSGEFEVEAAGRLYLGFNDGDIFSDNSGSWAVDLSIY